MNAYMCVCVFVYKRLLESAVCFIHLGCVCVRVSVFNQGIEWGLCQNWKLYLLALRTLADMNNIFKVYLKIHCPWAYLQGK